MYSALLRIVTFASHLARETLKAADTLVKDVALPKLFYCAPEEDIHSALKTMSAQKVRRLPVLDSKGVLQGILCLDDVVLYAEEKAADLTFFDVVATLKAICEHERGNLTLAVAR